MDGVLVQWTLNLYALSSVQLSRETSERLTRLIVGLIGGRVPLRRCLDESSFLTGVQEPIERLQSILSVPDTPPADGARDGDPGKKNRMWGPTEDARLLAAIHRHGVDNWRVIAQLVGNSRSCGQCSQRWFRVLDPRLSHCQWTGLEEFRLMQLVRYYGSRSWTQIAAHMGNRSDVQCRYHYRRMLADKPARREQGIKKAQSGSLPPPSFIDMQRPPAHSHQKADGALRPSRSVPLLPTAVVAPPKPQAESTVSGLVFDLVERLTAMENDSMKTANWY
jgi:hypothetical protein